MRLHLLRDAQWLAELLLLMCSHRWCSSLRGRNERQQPAGFLLLQDFTPLDLRSQSGEFIFDRR